MSQADLKRAEQLILEVNLLRGVILLEGDQLRVLQPDGLLPIATRSRIEAEFEGLVEYLTHGRILYESEIEERELTCDPRTDLHEDMDDWLLLLRRVFDSQGPESDVLQKLRRIRRAGAGIENGRIVPGQELKGMWSQIRREWLLPHAQAITDALEHVRNRGRAPSRVGELVGGGTPHA